MQVVRRSHVPALFCSLAVLVCELIAKPYANMGICDDGPYILVARTLANTGHIVYNGWSAAMLAWQLYLGAALIKLFGFSFTTVRLSTLFVAMVLAFVLQRTLVLTEINERNATIGPLALVLSPLYLLLSATFMSDIHGLFAIVLCLYGCLRALRSTSAYGAVSWLCFAVVTNVVCGTSRQLAWLGVLIMVPCTLWLMRKRRRVLLAGLAITLAGILFVLGGMVWLSHQPYTTPEKFLINYRQISLRHVASPFIGFFLELPFLILPVSFIFLFTLGRSRASTKISIIAPLIAFTFLAAYPNQFADHFRRLLQPTLRDFPGCDWVTIHGEYESVGHGTPPLFLPVWLQALFSAICFGGVIALILTVFRPGEVHSVAIAPGKVRWKDLGMILGPFVAAYIVLLTFRAASVVNDYTGILFDRYSLGLLLVALICLVRIFQERVQLKIPFAGVMVVLVMAAYGVVITHNTFACYRARVALASELQTANVPDTLVDNGWEYNIVTELHHAKYDNNFGIVSPAHAYVPTPRPTQGKCSMVYYDETPHVHPLYAVSFDPDACYGLAPFAPVHYARWLASSPGTLYVVKYTASLKP